MSSPDEYLEARRRWEEALASTEVDSRDRLEGRVTRPQLTYASEVPPVAEVQSSGQLVPRVMAAPPVVSVKYSFYKSLYSN